MYWRSEVLRGYTMTMCSLVKPQKATNKSVLLHIHAQILLRKRTCIKYHLNLLPLPKLSICGVLQLPHQMVGIPGHPRFQPPRKGNGWSLSSGRVEGSIIDHNSQQQKHASYVTKLDLSVDIGRTTLSSLTKLDLGVVIGCTTLSSLLTLSFLQVKYTDRKIIQILWAMSRPSKVRDSKWALSYESAK